MADETAPVLRNLSPDDGDVDVPVDTTVVLEILDEEGPATDTWGAGGRWGASVWK